MCTRLTKRAAILGRLFYHTALCVLGQTNPQEPPATHEEMRVLSLHHAHQLCGVIAHSKDRGISSVAIRCLATTGPALTSPAEQREVLGILSDLGSRSGWRVGRLKEELKGAWGWTVGRQTARGTPPARAGAGTRSTLADARFGVMSATCLSVNSMPVSLYGFRARFRPCRVQFRLMNQ